jgi:hypothetical protein
MTLRLLIAALLSGSLASCAVADGDVDDVAPKGRVDGSGTGDDDEDTGATPTIDSGSNAPDTLPASTDTGSADDTSSGTPCTTLSSTDCISSAEVLTAISGDTGGTGTTSGSDSKFIRIRVTENDSSVFSGKDLRARITLTSTGANFDLYVYMGATIGDGGGAECTTVKSSSTEPTGTPDVVALTWNDNRPIGGHDDARDLTIEVRAADASCAGASWSLTVEGNK